MAPSTVGVAPPPPGVTPNFDHPASIAYRVMVPAVIFPAIAIPICLLRLYTKRFILRLVTYDDYAIILATLLALGYSILVCYQTTNGLGTVYFYEIPAYRWHVFMKVSGIAGPLFYNLSTLFTKVSLSMVYLRLSQSLSLSFRVAVYAVMMISAIYSLIPAFGVLWLCRPIAKYWDISRTTGSCANFAAFLLAIGCINVATDLVLLLLPIRIIYHLHLPWPRKLGAALLLMAGSFVCVVSIIRVRIIILGMRGHQNDGTTRLIVDNTIWILIEMWLGVICACLSSLYSFFRKCFSIFFGRGPKPGSPAVHDPNNVRSHNHIPTSLPESAYYSGEISNFSLGTIYDPQTSYRVPVAETTV